MFVSDLIVTDDGEVVLAYDGDDEPCAIAWMAETRILSICLRRSGSVVEREVVDDLAGSLTGAGRIRVVRTGRSGPEAYWDLDIRKGSFSIERAGRLKSHFFSATSFSEPEFKTVLSMMGK